MLEPERSNTVMEPRGCAESWGKYLKKGLRLLQYPRHTGPGLQPFEVGRQLRLAGPRDRIVGVVERRKRRAIGEREGFARRPGSGDHWDDEVVSMAKVAAGLVGAERSC
jgi:hypothetical protein